jgi:hypothetical protein
MSDAQPGDIGKFEIELPNGEILTRDAMLEHIDYGPMYVDQITYSPHAKRVQLQSELGPQGLELTANEVREQWGETIHDDPIELHENNPSVAFNGLRLADSDLCVEVDVSVTGDDEDNVEAVAMYAKDQVVRAMQAVDQGKPPGETEGIGVEFDWDKILEEDA